MGLCKARQGKPDLEEVVGVGDDGDEAGGELLEHVPEGVALARPAPRRDRRVLRRRDRMAAHPAVVVLSQQLVIPEV